jgi:DNA recombination protein RmuC
MAESILIAIAAAALAFAAGWWLWARPLAAAHRELADRAGAERQALAELAHYKDRFEESRAAAEAERARADASATEIAALGAARAERDRAHEQQLEQLRGEFQRLAAEALERAQQRFSQSAAETLALHRSEAVKSLDAGRTAIDQLITPMRETLARYESELKAVEAKREQAYGGITQHLAEVARGQADVRTEANRIVAALRTSARASGAWGEAQLRNVLEMGGLREGIDFDLQSSVDGETGRRRPDALLRLPGDRQLIIDSKCSLGDYLAASEAADDTARAAALARHAQAVRAHARGLAQKAYWQEFARSADFVILFLPGENFLASALEQDLELLGWAFDQRILLAGPTNLLAIARVVAMVWRQEKIADEARAIGALGAELYASLATMADHVLRMGKSLGDATGHYNSFVASLESRVLVRARRFAELGVDPGKKPIGESAGIATVPRTPGAPELLSAPGAEG